MSFDQLNALVPAGVSPRLQAALHSSDPDKQLLALLVLLRTTNPLDIEIRAGGQPLPSFQLAAVLKATAQEIHSSELRTTPSFGFRLSEKLPKTLKVGQNLRIKADIIDKQGNICTLPTNSTCKLTILPTFTSISIDKRAKRPRKEYLCGPGEREIITFPLPF